MHAMQVLAAAAGGAGGQGVPARPKMPTTLGFHIILACFGIAFPTVVLVAEFRGLSRSDEVAMLLARRWSQVLGVLVAVGAVTGTVLSFEMGLLWPGLMRTYGAVLGVPCGFEGIFFFLEAIFTGIYLYGWQRLPGWIHFYTGLPIAITGLGGAVAVMAANSWMNSPGGFTLRGGTVVGVDPWQVFFNKATVYETPHMILAAYMVVGFGVAAVYAAGLLRGQRDRYHRLGFGIPFTIAAVLTPVQIFVGDTAARAIAAAQPVKFAAIEYVTQTGRDVPEYLGGFYVNAKVYLGLRIPYADSLLVGFKPSTKVTGLNSVAPALRPPALTLIHRWFAGMVGRAFLLLLAGLWALLVWRRRRALPRQRWFWWLAMACGPAALVAMECGWIVTEVGRQPWVVYQLMTTAQAATTNGGVIDSLTAVIILYAVLGVATVLILRMLARRWQQGEQAEPETGVPYGPPAD